MNNTATRYPLIDYLRVFAMLLMVIYHGSYDLAIYQLLSGAVVKHPAMIVLARSCLCLFLFCAGYSLAMSHSQGIRWRAFGKRWLMLALAAVAVSLGSFIYQPQYWIYFGILHCIAVCSLLCLPFLKLPHIAIIIGVIMMIAYWGWGLSLPWIKLTPSLDYIPVFPWIGPMLIGLGSQHFNVHKKIPLRPIGWMETLSRHSLLVYLLHQPLLLGVIYGFRQLL